MGCGEKIWEGFLEEKKVFELSPEGYVGREVWEGTYVKRIARQRPGVSTRHTVTEVCEFFFFFVPAFPIFSFFFFAVCDAFGALLFRVALVILLAMQQRNLSSV